MAVKKGEENYELTNLQMECDYKHRSRIGDIASSEKRMINVTTTMNCPGGTSEIVRNCFHQCRTKDLRLEERGHWIQHSRRPHNKIL